MLPAMPANSAMTLPKFVIRMPSIIRKVMRRPNSSRIRSLRPLPVTAPMRAHISCTTISATVIGIMVHSNVWPNCAPAAEYVKMPPASLSTFAVMNPGPTTAKNSRIWNFQRLRNFMRAVQGGSNMPNSRFRINGDGSSEQAKLRCRKEKIRVCRGRYSKLGAQHIDDIVGRDHAHQMILPVDHRQGKQVVLIEQLSKFFLFRIFLAVNQAVL